MGEGRGEIERSMERANSAALGFMADDVVVATFEYPELSQTSESALEQFVELLDSFADVPNHGFVVLSAPTQMRMAALSNSLGVSKLQLTGPDSQATAARLRDAARAVLERKATDAQLSDVRDCADSLGTLTLDQLLESRSRGASPWTSQTLSSY